MWDLYHIFYLQDSGIIMDEHGLEMEETVRSRDSKCLQKNSALRTWQGWCLHELTATVSTRTSPTQRHKTQNGARQNNSMDKEGAHEVLLLAEKVLILEKGQGKESQFSSSFYFVFWGYYVHREGNWQRCFELYWLSFITDLKIIMWKC